MLEKASKISESYFNPSVPSCPVPAELPMHEQRANPLNCGGFFFHGDFLTCALWQGTVPQTHILPCSSPGFCFSFKILVFVMMNAPAKVFESLGFGAVGEEKVSPRLHGGCVQGTGIPSSVSLGPLCRLPLKYSMF